MFRKGENLVATDYQMVRHPDIHQAQCLYPVSYTHLPVFVGSSLMFLKEGDRVSVRDLSRGLIVDSGNDACVALADYIAGGQRQFVEMMNNYAEKLHLKDTHFETVHGLDAPGQHSSAYDLAVLSRAIIHGAVSYTHLHSAGENLF